MLNYQIDPYSIVSELRIEQFEDEVLNNIMNKCATFISTTTEKYKGIYNKQEIVISFHFIKKKIKDLEKIRNSLYVETFNTPFKIIGHNVDLITLADEVQGYNIRSTYLQLATTIESTLDMMDFLYATLKRILHTYEGTRYDNNN